MDLQIFDLLRHPYKVGFITSLLTLNQRFRKYMFLIDFILLVCLSSTG